MHMHSIIIRTLVPLLVQFTKGDVGGKGRMN